MNAVAEESTGAPPGASVAPPKSATTFWSIERFVAFLLGPAVAAGAGWLSTFLAREIGIHVSAESMVVVFSGGALGAAGLAYKWLHGRQIEMQADVLVAKAKVASSVAMPGEAAIPPGEGLTEGGPAPPDVPIPAAASDPAPSTVADAGAASAQ